jgi:tryptophan synthase beta chain
MSAQRRFVLGPDDVPGEWYNILADLPFDLPPDKAAPKADGDTTSVRPQVPMELIRQSLGKRRFIPIPDAIRDILLRWRPTPLVRASELEAALKTRAKIFYKFEGNNASGSHKLNTAIAQAYYYKAAGVKRVTTGTGAGQWGTALALASQMFGLACKVWMVGISYQQKPYRRTAMRLSGAEVVSSPSRDTAVGRAMLKKEGPGAAGNIALAIAEAMEEANSTEGTRFCIGSGEPYSILHQTLIGLEAQKQMAMAAEHPDIVVASLGAGSNFGGVTLPFLGAQLRGESKARYVSVEPAVCPKLTRGVYRYDHTDGSGVTPLEKMYTLGSSFNTPPLHAGGLRYHATSKLISALYERKLIEAVAYQQRAVFDSAVLFYRTEGILPAPESAHAIHGAVVEALKANEAGTSPVILVCISGHGYFDLGAYEAFLDGELPDVSISEEEIARSVARIPEV